MQDSTDYPGEVFRLSLASGFYHPDLSARREVRALLDRWLDSQEGVPASEEVREKIGREKGSAHEPFLLNDADLDCAVFVVRAAFSKNLGITRVRIVSRDTIGNDGGLVITPGLRSYYVTRYPENECRGQPKGGWVFVPSAVPIGMACAPGRTVAALHAEDGGFRITVPLPDSELDPALYARSFQLGSRIYGVLESFNRLGLRVECRNGGIHVLSGSPESMIRCMAHMADRSSLILQGEKSNSRIPRILVRLDLPGEKPVALDALIGSTPDYLKWFSGHVPAAPLLDESHQFAISSWLRPSKEWFPSISKHFP
jgi:hypothetical protein